MIANSQILMMAITGIISLLLPFIFIVILKRKYKIYWLPMLVGAAIFLVFALILEQILHMIVLKPSVDGQIELLNQSPWLYVLYGVLAAGIFEETGRLLAFYSMKRKYKDVGTAVSYGIGHGGFEAIVVVGLGMVNAIILSFMINSSSPVLNDLPIDMDQLVSDQAWYMYLLAIFERIIAMTLHIALSVLVFYAVMKKGKIYYYFLAIILHALANTNAAMMQAGLLDNISLMYASLIIMTLVTVFLSRKVSLNQENII